LCIQFDQALKIYVRATLPPVSPISLLDGIIELRYAEASGVFMGLGVGWPNILRHIVLILLAALILISLLGFTVRSRLLNIRQLMGMALIAGGGLSNLIDRVVRNGAVIDYINVGYRNIRTGMFNFADAAVLIGAIVLILSTPTDRESTIETIYSDSSTRRRRRPRVES